MPYAAKAIIEHEFDVDHLNIFVTFRHPMNQDFKPALGLWLLECDDVSVDVVDSDWQDQFTLLLTSDSLVSSPDDVTLEYDGPSSSLATTWGKQWEPWGPILSTYLNAYEQPSFVDRGDPAAFDFSVVDFTTDGVWHSLDISSIVPEGASAVVIRTRIFDNLSGQYFVLRRHGLANDICTFVSRTYVASAFIDGLAVISLDSSRLVDYRCSNTVWSSIDIVVNGWFV